MFSLKYLRLVLVSAVCAASFLLAACEKSQKATAEENRTAANVNQTPIRTLASSNEPVTIAAVGDIMLGSTFPNETRMPPNDGADSLAAVTPILSAADIAFGNLEGPMLEGGVSEKCGEPKPNQPVRCFAFRVPTRYGKHLKAAGFDVLSVANNHAGDFGDAGRASTRRVLDELGIKHAGSDRGQYSTVYLEVKGKKIAFIGFAHNNISLNVNDLTAARNAVQAAVKKAEIVVVSFHGGAEGAANTRVPNKTEMFFGEARGNLRQFARTVIDAGADVVLGHGPHVLRGMEIYQNRLVAYSLGNFATYGWFQLKGATAETTVLELKLAADGQFLSGKINPFVLTGRGIPVRDETKSAVTTFRNLSVADFGANAPQIKPDGTF